MKKILIGLAVVATIIGSHVATVSAAPTSTIVQNLIVTNLATTTANIAIAPNSAGLLTIVPMTAVAATTTINGASGPAFTFTASGPGLTITTSTNTVTFTYSTSTLGLKTASVYSFGDFLSSSTVYVGSANGISGALTFATSGLLTVATSSGTITYGFASSTLNLGTASIFASTDFLSSSTAYVATNTGNWLGTWQGINTSTVIQSASTFQAGDMLYYNGTSWLRFEGNPSTSTVKFLSQFGNNNPTWQTVPSGGAYTYYLHTASSTNLPDYKNASTTEITTNMASTTTGTVATTTAVMAWLTASSTPNLTSIPAGVWHLHIDAIKTGGTAELRFYAEIFLYSGGSETLLGTTQNSRAITGTNDANPDEIDLEFSTSTISLSTADRIGVRWYATKATAGSNVSGAIYYQGVTAARIEFPSVTVDASNFVPYTGATANLNLGSYTLLSTLASSTGLTFTNATGSGNLQAGTVSSTGITFTNATGSGNFQVNTASTTGLTFTNATGSGNFQVGTGIFTTLASSTGFTFTNATGSGNLQVGTVSSTGITFTNATSSGNLQTATVSSTGITFTNATSSGNLQVGTVSSTGMTFTNATGSSNLQVATLKTTGAVNASSTMTVEATTTVRGKLLDSSGYKYSPWISAYFIIENPTSTEDDAFYVFRTTSTIREVWAVNKALGDTATINLTHATSRAQATSTSKHLFTAYTAITATTTPACYAAATTTSCSTGVFGATASSSVGAGSVLRLTATAASSSQLFVHMYYTED